MSTKHIFLRSLIAATFVLACFVSLNVQAAVWTLTDANSRATINDSSSAGMTSWSVDGVNQLYQQWFWYRVGSAATTPETPINLLPSGASSLTTASQTNSASLSLLYTAPRFTIDILYGLQGGLSGSGGAGTTENITINNTSRTALDFHFFQYSDFDLGGTAGGQSVTFTGLNTVDQTLGGTTLSETVVSPTPSRHEASFWPTILSSLTNGTPTTLSNLPAVGGSTAPPLGDVTWAFEWDRSGTNSIAAGHSLNIVKGKNITNITPVVADVPEPASLAIWGFLAIGMAAGSRFRRRRS
jgi:hypothetical protein